MIKEIWLDKIAETLSSTVSELKGEETDIPEDARVETGGISPDVDENYVVITVTIPVVVKARNVGRLLNLIKTEGYSR